MSDNSIPPLGSVWRKKTGEHAGELVTVVERSSVKYRTANGELWTASVSSWNEKMEPFVETDLVEELRKALAALQTSPSHTQLDEIDLEQIESAIANAIVKLEQQPAEPQGEKSIEKEHG